MRCTKATSKRSRGLSRQRRRRATRYPFTRRVERISENFPPPVLEHVLESLTRAVHRFHSDNGSGQVNYQMTALLEKLRVAEFTMSRPRRSNDNGLAESENGSVLRKVFGRWHIAGGPRRATESLPLRDPGAVPELPPDGPVRTRGDGRQGQEARGRPASPHPHPVPGAESAAGGRAPLVREVRLAALRPSVLRSNHGNHP